MISGCCIAIKDMPVCDDDTCAAGDKIKDLEREREADRARLHELEHIREIADHQTGIVAEQGALIGRLVGVVGKYHDEDSDMEAWAGECEKHGLYQLAGYLRSVDALLAEIAVREEPPYTLPTRQA